MNMADTSNSAVRSHPEFELLRSQHIESLNVFVCQYRHKNTGAQHIHIAADNKENVFLVAVRTVPMDSSGVAHMLEHTALCGSKRYPVRDPFFMMGRRSLNTFMNAFTSADWTAYPFASQNRKDFNNLLDVYLDAVFFSRLDPLDFAQEGHRLEFEKIEDASSKLLYKGVVFNEMKGALSSSTSFLWKTLSRYLFSNSTYHYCSGGDPTEIVKLDYASLKAFYHRHYRPSNAIFMTFGDIPAYDHQQKFQLGVLDRFGKDDYEISVAEETRLQAPITVETYYPANEMEAAPGQAKCHVVLSWLLDKSTDLEKMLEAELLATVLLDNSASPLQQALETTALGNSPSLLTGLDSSGREMVFVCGLEGCKAQDADAIETLILNVFKQVAELGVTMDKLEAALHQLELSQREIDSHAYPYGLQLILSALTPAIHRGDVLGLLNLDPALAALREKIKQPLYLTGLIQSFFLDNPHRVRLTLKPDDQLAKRQDKAEQDQLTLIQQGLDEAGIQQIIKQASDLALRQEQPDDPSLLPKVGLEDIPLSVDIADPSVLSAQEKSWSYPYTFFAQGTNGLAYQQIVIRLTHVDDDLLAYMPLYTAFMTNLGCDGKDYLQTQAWQASCSGGLAAYFTIKGTVDDVADIQGYFVLSGKSLSRNYPDFSKLMHQTLESVEFDEFQRIKELISQRKARLEQSVVGNGHVLAMMAAASGMSPIAAYTHQVHGLPSISFIKKLAKDIEDEGILHEVAVKLKRLHQLILAAPRQLLAVGEAKFQQVYAQQLQNCWQDTLPSKDLALKPLTLALPSVEQSIQQYWSTTTQVNFCAICFKTVPVEHPDAAPLTILGPFLTNGYLHTTLREKGGAYGGFANHDASIPAFRICTYRDPRLKESLDDMQASLNWLLETTHEARQLEEAIIGVIGSMDKPGSPASEAKQAFHNALFGRSREQQQRLRERLLRVTLADLRRVGQCYLQAEVANRAIIGSEDNATCHQDLGLTLHKM